MAPQPKRAPKRKQAGRIDVDDRIEQAKKKSKEAKAALKKAVHEARNEKRRRSRLMKKAGSLSVEDLQRISQLKRAGLWDPVFGVAAPSTPTHGESANASNAVSVPSASPAAAAAGAVAGDVSGAPRMSETNTTTSPHSEHENLSHRDEKGDSNSDIEG